MSNDKKWRFKRLRAHSLLFLFIYFEYFFDVLMLVHIFCSVSFFNCVSQPVTFRSLFHCAAYINNKSKTLKICRLCVVAIALNNVSESNNKQCFFGHTQRVNDRHYFGMALDLQSSALNTHTIARIFTAPYTKKKHQFFFIWRSEREKKTVFHKLR